MHRPAVPTELSPELENRILTEWGWAIWGFLVEVGSDPNTLAEIAERAGKQDEVNERTRLARERRALRDTAP